MSIRKWHKGKLIILWAWGIAIVSLLMTDFLTSSVQSSPSRHSVEFLVTLLVLLALSAVTWRWLGDRNQPAPTEEPHSSEP
jgi:quinol-cytochrome oxidoreductase complex cytochrome b subunit